MTTVSGGGGDGAWKCEIKQTVTTITGIGTHDDAKYYIYYDISFLNPLLGIFQNFCQLVFSGARSRGVHVLPVSLERE